MAEYTLAQRSDPGAEPARLARIHAYQDPPTINRLTALGVTSGWHCLDVGAGGGSIAKWLSDRVGPTGYVLATDLETDALTATTGDAVAVQRHDVRTEPLPAAAFDLVHARLLLTHLPERAAVLRNIAGAARPGALVLIGDIDFSTVRAASPLMEGVFAAFDTAVRRAGWEPALGPQLPAMLDDAGLLAIEAENSQVLQRGGDAVPSILAMTYRRLRPLLLEAGPVTEAELDAADRWLADPANAVLGPTIWAAWGRRP